MKIFLTLLIFAFPIFAKSKNVVRSGNHNLTLQWLESKKPGKIFFKKLSDKEFEVEGEQKNPEKDDYLTIQGTITVKSPTELQFVGQIITKVHHIFEGKPCLRKEVQIFKAHGKRKYWRMQDKINCDGVVTDYIDIYF